MWRIKLACLLLIFVQVQRVVLGTHDVYIVVMEGDPVVSYRGGVDGFPATAVDLDEEMDVTRYLPTPADAFVFFAMALKHKRMQDWLLLDFVYQALLLFEFACCYLSYRILDVKPESS